LDKKLLTFWKLFRKKNQRPRGNWLDGSSCSKLDKRDIFTGSVVLPGWDLYLLHCVLQLIRNMPHDLWRNMFRFSFE
jgi:hypothetical protein